MVYLGLFSLLIIFVLFMVLLGGPFSLWFQTIVSGARIGFWDVVKMRFQKVPANLIVNGTITASKAGLGIRSEQLVAHYQAEGNVIAVVHAMVAASKAMIDLDFERACAIDLAGIDVLDIIRTAVCPKDVTADPIRVTAKDGVELSIVFTYIVRSNPDRIIGGADYNTIISRVSEEAIGVVAAIDKHEKILTNPAVCSKKLLEKGLDFGTAYELLGLNITAIEKA